MFLTGFVFAGYTQCGNDCVCVSNCSEGIKPQSHKANNPNLLLVVRLWKWRDCCAGRVTAQLHTSHPDAKACLLGYLEANSGEAGQCHSVSMQAASTRPETAVSAADQGTEVCKFGAICCLWSGIQFVSFECGGVHCLKRSVWNTEDLTITPPAVVLQNVNGRRCSWL